MINDQFIKLENQRGKGVVQAQQTEGCFYLPMYKKFLKIPHERRNGVYLNLNERLAVIRKEQQQLEIIAPGSVNGVIAIVKCGDSYMLERVNKTTSTENIVDYALTISNTLPVDIDSDFIMNSYFHSAGVRLKVFHQHHGKVEGGSKILNPVSIMDEFEPHTIMGDVEYVQHVIDRIQKALKGMRPYKADKVVRLHGNYSTSNTILVDGELCVINPAYDNLFGSPLMDLANMASSLYYAKKEDFVNALLLGYYGGNEEAVKSIKDELHYYVAYFLLENGYQKLKLATHAGGDDKTYLLHHGGTILNYAQIFINSR